MSTDTTVKFDWKKIPWWGYTAWGIGILLILTLFGYMFYASIFIEWYRGYYPKYECNLSGCSSDKKVIAISLSRPSLLNEKVPLKEIENSLQEKFKEQVSVEITKSQLVLIANREIDDCLAEQFAAMAVAYIIPDQIWWVEGSHNHNDFPAYLNCSE